MTNSIILKLVACAAITLCMVFPSEGAAAPEDREQVLQEANMLISRGRLVGARMMLASHLETMPDDPAATFLLGITHHRERSYAVAAPLLERALELEPDILVAHHFLGWAHFHLGDLDAAAASFQSHMRLQPGEPDTNFGLGLVAIERGDFPLARTHINDCIRMILAMEENAPERFAARARDLGKCYARLGDIAFAEGDFETARTELERGFSIDSRQYTAAFTLSQVHRQLGNDEESAAWMKRYEEIVAARNGKSPSGGTDPANNNPSESTDPAQPDDRPMSADQTMPDAPARFAMTDVTAASGLDFTTTSGRDPSTLILEVKGGGLAVIDFDQDGDPDILIPNGATIESPDAGPGARVYENLGGMRFRDATERSGLATNAWVFGCASGDVNHDGVPDIYLSCFGRDQLFLGTSDGRFSRVEGFDAAGVTDGWSTACSFGDVNHDGHLDLYVSSYIRLDLADPPPPTVFRGQTVLAGPRGLPAAHDVLMLGDGTGNFTDVSTTSGLRELDARYGLACMILDFNHDGQAEIFVGNDSQPNRLLRIDADDADNARVKDVGVEWGLATSGDGAPRATMGLSVADLNDDGRPDLLTTNFAGEPNTLQLSTDGDFYLDATSRMGIGAPSRSRLGWGCAIADLDHDGADEMLVVNGHVYPGATRETLLADESQPPLLLTRDPGTARFRIAVDTASTNASTSSSSGHAWLDAAYRDRTLLLADFDADGDLDAVIGGLNQAVRLLRNDGAAGDWLQVKPGGDSLGAMVTVTSGDNRWTRWIASGDGYCSASWPTAHFGLGSGSQTAPAPGAESSPRTMSVTVTWADGVTRTLNDVAANGRITVARPESDKEKP